MNKKEFIETLKQELKELQKNELDKIVNYYEELINDKLEDNIDEKEAIESLGNLNEIIEEIKNDSSIERVEENKNNQDKTRENIQQKVVGNERGDNQKKEKSVDRTIIIILLIIFSPVWLSIIFSLYISVLSIILSLYLTVLAFALAGIAAIILIFTTGTANIPAAILSLGLGLFFIGLTIFLMKLLNTLMVKIVSLHNKGINWIWRKLSGKGSNE